MFVTSEIFFISNTVAPKIAGMNNKNENLAACLGFILFINPVDIVNPERDIPGRIAKACEIPIKAVFFRFKDLFFFIGYFDRNKNTEVIINEIPTVKLLLNIDFIWEFKKNPANAIGIEAIIKYVKSFN